MRLGHRFNGKAGKVELGDKEHQARLRAAGNSGEKGENQMAAGTAANVAGNQWHNVKLQFSGSTITGFVDGAQVLSVTNTSLFARHGRADYRRHRQTETPRCFDNLLINAVGAATPKPTVFAKNQSPIYKP